MRKKVQGTHWRSFLFTGRNGIYRKYHSGQTTLFQDIPYIRTSDILAIKLILELWITSKTHPVSTIGIICDGKNYKRTRKPHATVRLTKQCESTQLEHLPHLDGLWWEKADSHCIHTENKSAKNLVPNKGRTSAGKEPTRKETRRKPIRWASKEVTLNGHPNKEYAKDNTGFAKPK